MPCGMFPSCRSAGRRNCILATTVGSGIDSAVTPRKLASSGKPTCVAVHPHAGRLGQAYSCRELEFFKLNIFAIHEATSASVDWNQMDTCGGPADCRRALTSPGRWRGSTSRRSRFAARL